ncbi:MAG: hypothetical protein AAGA80_04160, partial [Cyanobacteria bacterium P01_F01_bin.143]
MAEIIYSPQVHLFAFHLFRTPDLGNGHDSNPELLWNKCHELIFPKFFIKDKLILKDSKPKNQRFELLNSSDIYLPIHTKIHHQAEPLALEGFVYPLQIYDSYGLGFTIGFPDPQPQEFQGTTIETRTSILEEFNPDYSLLPDFIESDLGQTLIITAWLDKQQQKLDRESLKNLADECLRAFIPPKEKRPLFHCDGNLFDSPIFEYGLIRSGGTYRHILVWLFTDPQTSDKFYDSYNSLLDLLFYRNKVIREYQNSRDIYSEIYQEY